MLIYRTLVNATGVSLLTILIKDLEDCGPNSLPFVLYRGDFNTRYRTSEYVSQVYLLNELY